MLPSKYLPACIKGLNDAQNLPQYYVIYKIKLIIICELAVKNQTIKIQVIT